MSTTFLGDFPSVLPRPNILIDSCFALDELGLWATARLVAARINELDLFLPARRTVRRLEIGHGEESMGQLGHGSRQRLLGALDKALAKPLKLVFDTRKSDGSAQSLGKTGATDHAAAHALGSLLGANSYTVADYALEFSIQEPRADRLALGASSVFGPHMASLFRVPRRAAGPLHGGLVPIALSTSTTARRQPRSPLKVARYIRTATVKAAGPNSLEAQSHRIDQRLKELGLRTTHNVVDEGCSGMGAGRTGIETLLRLAERGEIDVVFASSADRLFRSASGFDRFAMRLRSLGVALMLVDHGAPSDLLVAMRRSGRRRS